MEIADIIKNTALLKLDLMIRGIRLPVSSYQQGDRLRGFPAVEGIEIELDEGIKVRAPYQDRMAVNSPYMLDESMQAIIAEEYSIPVRVRQDVQLMEGKTSQGVSMSDIAYRYGKYLAITPDPSCGFFGERLKCMFCSLQRPPEHKGHIAGIDDVLETIRAACRIRKPSAILLSIANTDTEDAGMAFAEQYIRAIHKQFNVIIMLEMSPPKDTRWIETAYGAGADAICFNIEVFDERLFAELCPGKAKENGRQRYMDALHHAGGIFPRGTVMTHLIAGIEPLESTIEGIEYLASNAIVPILSVFRPLSARMMRFYHPLSVEEFLPVYRAVHCSLKRHHLPAAWTKYMGFAITPAEAKLFGCDNRVKRQISIMMENSGFVDTVKAGMLRMRRSLRVKEV